MKTMKLIFGLLIISIAGIAQTTGIMKGTVLDEKKQPMPFAPVSITQDASVIANAQTDINGEFTVKELTPGNYTVKGTYTGYNIQLLQKVNINPNEVRYVTLNLTPSQNDLPPITFSVIYEEPVIKPEFSVVTAIKIDQIEHSPLKNDIIGMISTVPGVMPTADGTDIYVRGSRRGSTAYYVDGQRLLGSPDVPGIGISGMEVLTGGVPAMYGDCTGGLVIITTKEYKWEMNRKQNEIDDRKERDAKAKREKENKINEME